MISSLVSGQMLAQEVESRPFAEDHKVWIYQHYYFPQKYHSKYYTEGDTVIANIPCFKLYGEKKEENGIVYLGGIYDQEKKSYWIPEGEVIPRLLLDFSREAGDVFMIGNDNLLVEKDTVMVFGDATGLMYPCQYRVFLIYNKTQSYDEGRDYNLSKGYWIEGVGSTAPYYFYPSYWDGYNYNRMAACLVNGGLIYCDEEYVPVTNHIESHKKNPKNNLLFYDLQGRMLQSNKATKLQNNTLLKGVYIVNGKKVVIK